MFKDLLTYKEIIKDNSNETMIIRNILVRFAVFNAILGVGDPARLYLAVSGVYVVVGAVDMVVEKFFAVS